jgi:23S rRNA (uracil1939-C5)-methyltransferase
VQKNDILNISVTGLNSACEGVARVNDMVVFVKDTCPGDRAEVKIINVKNAYAYGRLLNIITPSANRVKPLCPQAGKCGGCTLQHYAYAAQTEFKHNKTADALRRVGHFMIDESAGATVLPAVAMGHPYRYRNKGLFPVGWVNGQASIGLYARHSHRLVSVKSCLLMPEVNDYVLEAISEYIPHISVYDEANHTGLLRQIMTRIGETLMVCLVVNGRQIPHKDMLIKRLKRIPEFTALAVNINSERTNTVLGKETLALYGPDVIRATLGSVVYEISAASFFQVNPAQTKVLYDIILDYAALTGNETILDIYCGSGGIALYLARYAKQVLGIEINAVAIVNAQHNAKLNKIGNCSFIQGDAAHCVSGLLEKHKPDIVVLDPPRKGCEKALLTAVCNTDKLIYVSCDPATLSRDARILADNGMKLVKIQPIDMFPQTAHVENVALFTRASSGETAFQ